MANTERVRGPIDGTRLTQAYARTMARAIYFWAWPMVNVYNRRLGFAGLKEPGRLGGALDALTNSTAGAADGVDDEVASVDAITRGQWAG